MGWRSIWRCVCGWAAVGGGAALVAGMFAVNVWNITIDAKALGSTEHCSHPPLKAFLIGSIVSSALTISTCGFALPAVHVVFAILGHVWYHQGKALCSHTAPLMLRTTAQSLAVLWSTAASNIVTLMVFGFCPILAAADSSSGHHCC